MSSTTSRPNPTTPWVTPYFMVQDVTRSMDFYQAAFDTQKGEIAPDEHGQAAHGEFYYQGQLLMMGKEGCYGGTVQSPATSGIESPMNLYLYCDDVDTFYQHALKAGAEALGAPENAFWGDRFCRLKCLNGYLWLFATHITQ